MARFSKFFILSLAISLILFTTLFFSSPFANSNKENKTMNEVVVVQGDTLWSIAKTYNSSDNDIRELIYYIKKINQLTTAQIHPGQTLFIPNL